MLSVARIMPFYTQTVSHSANPPFLKVFLFRRVLLGIFLSEILLFFTQKSPTLFAKKGGKMQSFFKFFLRFLACHSSFFYFFLFSWGFGYSAFFTMQPFLKKQIAYFRIG